VFGALVLLTGNPARPWLVEREYQRNSISITITYKFFPPSHVFWHWSLCRQVRLRLSCQSDRL
jgi:hypothetical protein